MWLDMVPMSSVEPVNREEAELLLELARESIRDGLAGGRGLKVDASDYAPSLARHGASFVTLKLDGDLRGCIGHLEARQPLVQDVVENAWLAAFRDRRFAPLSNDEFSRLDLSISILSLPEALVFDSEEELLQKIRPGIDGLILSEGARMGTFLPSVWRSLPEPREFLRHLKQKAGLPADYWSETINVERYTTQSIHYNNSHCTC